MRIFGRLFGARSNAAKRKHEVSDSWSLAPAERVGPLPGRSRSRWVGKFFVASGILTLAGLSYDDPSLLLRWWAIVSDAAARLQADAASPAHPTPERQPPEPAPKADEPAQKAASASDSLAAATPLLEAVPAQLPLAGTAAPSSTAHAAAPSTTGATHKPTPYAPPTIVTVVDPYETRAKAAGLHPDLSRELLARLTDADFRNAAFATQTALAKTPDEGTFKWPRHREAGLAIFEVRFVPGAAPHCRRYVVTVEKERWQTTAPPVDSCGKVGRLTGN